MKKNGVGAVKRVRSHTKSIVRFSAIALLLLIQIALMCVAIYYLNRYAVLFYVIFDVFSFLIAVPLVAQERNAAYKLYWMCVLLLLPGVGHLMYFFWGGMLGNRRAHGKIQKAVDEANEYSREGRDEVTEFAFETGSKNKISKYLTGQGFPLYDNTEISYFDIGEKALADMTERLCEAQKYIFMSFFIIADGVIWDRMCEILEKKCKEGVRVCVMYDDAGSILQLSDSTVLRLKNAGIEMRNFNPVERNYQRLFLNFRNHQKIMVIDGEYAYTGGINISDRYANLISPLGHWKDTGIRLHGDGAYALQLSFIGMWNASGGNLAPADYPMVKFAAEKGVRCQPFVDGPSNNPNNPAMDMFLHQILSARERVDIMTPYLIIDDVMQEVLILAAKSGVLIRIITPGIPDKRTVGMMTQRHYGKLLAAGIRIFEYTPGFVHAKLCANEASALIGSINMDFRSFFLHYENGVWIPEGEVLQVISDDFEDTITKCKEVTYEEWKHRPLLTKMLQEMLYIIKCQF